MCKNIKKHERIIRVVVGLAILGAGWYFQSWWGIIGIVPLFTGCSGYCPAYKATCQGSCKKGDKDACKCTKENCDC